MSALRRCVPILVPLILAPTAARADIPVVEVVDVIHAVSAAHVVSAIEQADAAGAPLLIVRLDTPGGYLSSMKQIIDKMLNCKTPVAVFVGPSGASGTSAGFLITIVADVAAMAPGTNIGAAHPVTGSGEKMDEVMSKKATSDTAAYIRGKVERRGRNVELAEKGVTESQSFTEKEALEKRLIDYVVKDVDELVAVLDGKTIKKFDGTMVTLDLKGQRIVTYAMNWRQRVLSTIARPEILFLLLLGALAGLGTEISHPGMLFPGIVGTVCLILFLFATQIIPVNWAGVLLILFAIALFIAEVKVTSYGILTVGGLTAMVLGAMMLVDAPIPEMRVPLRIVLPAVLVIAAWSLTLVTLVVRSRRVPVTTGTAGMIGQQAVADGDLTPSGWVRVMGEKWRAEADGVVGAGETVTVVAVKGLTLTVRKGAS